MKNGTAGSLSSDRHGAVGGVLSWGGTHLLGLRAGVPGTEVRSPAAGHARASTCRSTASLHFWAWDFAPHWSVLPGEQDGLQQGQQE